MGKHSAPEPLVPFSGTPQRDPESSLFDRLDLQYLAELDNACRRGLRVRWEHDGLAVDGVARNFTDEEGNHWPWIGADVRDAHLRISGTMEWFRPVRIVLTEMDQGTFYVDTSED